VDFYELDRAGEMIDRKLGSSATSVTGSSSSASASSSSSSHASAHSSHNHPHNAMFFMFNAFIIGTVCLHVASLPALHSLQQTVCLFVLGILYSLLLEGLSLNSHFGVFGSSYDMWMAIDPHLLLFSMLPALLAGDAMSINTAVARTVAQQCLFLAGPGVLIGSFLTAGFLYALMPDWSFMLCLTCGSILAATDPVAVVGLLKELGASPTLTVQIQGESLLNDGTAIVLYSVAYNILGGETYDATDIMIFLVLVAGCAVGLGLIIGYLFYLWIKLASDRLNHHAGMIQTALTLCCAYWSFCIAEGALHISGVLCTVTASLVLADKMWPVIVDKHGLHHIWHMFEYLGNTLIFFLAGALTGNTMVHIPAIDYARLFAIYIACMTIRGTFLFSARPVLSLLSLDKDPVKIPDVIVMTWGGLRGAVGLALAIQVSIDQAGGNISEMDGRRVLFYVGGVATLTLCINATTCPALVRKLGITKTTKSKQRMLVKIYDQLPSLLEQENPSEAVQATVDELLHEIKEDLDNLLPETSLKKLSKMKTLGSLASLDQYDFLEIRRRRAELRALRPSSDIDENYEHAREIFDATVSPQHLAILECPVFPFGKQEQDLRLLIEEQTCDPQIMKSINSSFMALVNNEYWKQLDAGEFLGNISDAEMLMSTTALSIKHAGSHICDLKYLLMRLRITHDETGADSACLNEIIEEAEDLEGRSKRGGSMSSVGSTGSIMRQYSGAMKDSIMSIVDAESPCMEMLGVRRGKVGGPDTWLIRAIDSTAVHIAVSAVLLLNSVFILIEQTQRSGANYHHKAWLICELTFASIFTLECIIKLIALRCGYFMSGWNWFDFSILGLTYFGLVTELADYDSGGDVSNEARVFRLNRLFRVLRILRLVRFMKLFRIFLLKMNEGERCIELGERMRTITILRSFVHAHIAAQEELVKLYGEAGKITRCEEARAILESQTELYIALRLAAHEADEAEVDSVVTIRMLREATKINRKMADFVHEVQSAGVITGRGQPSS
jgi:NhaP-type Na+/H+ or K+/H+ antiporter